MRTVSCTYNGDLRCTAVHNKSGKMFKTDAPVDHKGKGRSFSPTDLTATSLGTCILTFMGIYCQDKNWNMNGATCDVQKIMGSHPERNIEKLELYICLPDTLTTEQIEELREVAHHCPIVITLNCHVEIEFYWVCDVS